MNPYRSTLIAALCSALFLPIIASPAPVSITLPTPGVLELTIETDDPAVFSLESSVDLIDWDPVQAIVLTSAPRSLEVPFSADLDRFFVRLVPVPIQSLPEADAFNPADVNFELDTLQDLAVNGFSNPNPGLVLLNWVPPLIASETFPGSIGDYQVDRTVADLDPAEIIRLPVFIVFEAGDGGSLGGQGFDLGGRNEDQTDPIPATIRIPCRVDSGDGEEERERLTIVGNQVIVGDLEVDVDAFLPIEGRSLAARISSVVFTRQPFPSEERIEAACSEGASVNVSNVALYSLSERREGFVSQGDLVIYEITTISIVVERAMTFDCTNGFRETVTFRFNYDSRFFFDGPDGQVILEETTNATYATRRDFPPGLPF